jgi:signal peptidase I
MFGFFASPEKKARASAGHWLELAQKVWRFRRDVLAPALLAELEARSTALGALLRERADAGRITLGMQALEDTLRRAGGTHYPRSEVVEWVEFLLVAAIVIIGVQHYFMRPFQIPTNSMWPSQYGMTPEVFTDRAQEPGPLQTALRVATVGVRPDRIYRIDAPADGEVLVPLSENGVVPSEDAAGRALWVLPSAQREFRLFVGGRAVAVRVPVDFAASIGWVVRDAFFPAPVGSVETAEETLLRRSRAPGAVAQVLVEGGPGGPRPVRVLRTGKFVRAGERMLSFDIRSGDMLMVDRLSYHFVQPKIGDGFVFRTDNIKSPYMTDARTGGQLQQYYIKRLVGVPGDRLQVRPPVLYRNGQPITGAAAFDKEARQVERYPGYRTDERLDYLRPGQVLTVPPDKYFAMGDNSPNSQDSRYWGFVPGPDVVGRPLFTYYPFARLLP